MAASLPSSKRPRFLADTPTTRTVQPASFGRPSAPPEPDGAGPQPPARLPERSDLRPAAAAPPARPAAPTAAPSPGIESMGAAVEALRLLGAKLAEQARADALEIAFQIARRILETELTTSPQPLFALVRSAVRRVGEAREITLRLSPQDAPLVESRPREDLGLSLAKVAIVPDPSLQRGDCIVESDLGTVDGRLSVRLSELKRSLSEALSGDAA